MKPYTNVLKHPGRSITTLTLAVGITAGCALFSPQALHVEVAAEEAVASPEGPALVSVTATNLGDRRASWGHGSSTCQLALLVRVDGTDYYASPERVCTADSRLLSLESGQSRTEVLAWTGRAQIGQAVIQLEPGEYELRGAAGHESTSAPILVTLRAEP